MVETTNAAEARVSRSDLVAVMANGAQPLSVRRTKAAAAITWAVIRWKAAMPYVSC